MAAQHDFLFVQGARFWRALTWRWYEGGPPVDVSGFTARMQVRSKPGAPVLLELSTANGRITLNGGAGLIVLEVSTAAMQNVNWGCAVYDLIVTDDAGEDEQLLVGHAMLVRRVTS